MSLLDVLFPRKVIRKESPAIVSTTEHPDERKRRLKREANIRFRQKNPSYHKDYKRRPEVRKKETAAQRRRRKDPKVHARKLAWEALWRSRNPEYAERKRIRERNRRKKAKEDAQHTTSG